MNKFNFGESKLPPGFRFQPTDEEIVFQYLAPKTFSYPLPASVIPEINMQVSSLDPRELPGNMEQDRYFFAKRQKNRMILGFWKCTSLDKKIICSKTRMPIFGMKKTLVFYKGKNPTNCFMHLFCIALPQNTSFNNKGSFIQIGKWNLCHVFWKRSTIKRQINYDHFVRKEESSDAGFSSSSSSFDSNFDSDSDSIPAVFSVRSLVVEKTIN